MVARSVVFYEQSLVEAMRTAIVQEVSDDPQFSYFIASKQQSRFDSEVFDTPFFESEMESVQKEKGEQSSCGNSIMFDKSSFTNLQQHLENLHPREFLMYPRS